MPKQSQPLRRSVYFLVIVLWGIGFSIGGFSVWQVVRLSGDLRRVSDRVVHLSHQFSSLSHEKILLIHNLERLQVAAYDGVISADEHTELGGVAPEAETAFQRQRNLLIAMRRQIEGIASEETNRREVRETLERSILSALRDSTRVQELLPLFRSAPGPITADNRHALIGALDEVQQDLSRANAELGEILNLVVGEVIARTESSQRWVASQVVLAAIAGLFVGAIIVAQFRSQNRRLIETEQLAVLGKVAVTIQHEINNPLSVIIGQTYLLRHGKLRNEDREMALGSIEEAAEVIAAVVRRAKHLRTVQTVPYVGDEEMLNLGDPSAANEIKRS